MNQRTTSEIERDLDRTRAEMSQTIDALQERLSPGQLFEQGMRYFYSGGGRSFTDGAAEFAQNFGRAVRDNPIPFALVTTGLVWLMLGRGRRRSPGLDLYEDYEEYDALQDYEDYYPAMEDEPVEGDWPAHDGSSDKARGGYEQQSDVATPASATADAPGPTSQAGGAPPYRGGLGGSVGAASVGEQRAQEAARRAEMASGTERQEHDREATRRTFEAAEEARRQALRAARAADEARRAADRAGGGLREGVRGRADAAREWAGETAHDARQRIPRTAEGTRRTFGRTRRSARGAAQSARYQMRRARGGFAHLIEERPLLVGAIGLAVGVALGAVLPTTRREDAWFGESRDSLKRRARAEYGKAERVAQRAYDTARSEAERQELTPEGARRAARETLQEAERAAEERLRQTARDVEHAAEDRLKDVEGRMRKVGEAVTEAAKDEAERQHLAGTGGRSASAETGATSPGQPGGDQKQA
jgi:Protein of unknown function (DUF3618)